MVKSSILKLCTAKYIKIYKKYITNICT